MRDLIERIQDWNSRLTADALVIGMMSIVTQMVGIFFTLSVIVNVFHLSTAFGAEYSGRTAVILMLAGQAMLAFSLYLWYQAGESMFPTCEKLLKQLARQVEPK